MNLIKTIAPVFVLFSLICSPVYAAQFSEEEMKKLQTAADTNSQEAIFNLAKEVQRQGDREKDKILMSVLASTDYKYAYKQAVQTALYDHDDFEACKWIKLDERRGVGASKNDPVLMMAMMAAPCEKLSPEKLSDAEDFAKNFKGLTVSEALSAYGIEVASNKVKEPCTLDQVLQMKAYGLSDEEIKSKCSCLGGEDNVQSGQIYN